MEKGDCQELVDSRKRKTKGGGLRMWEMFVTLTCIFAQPTI
jgi:hypothetical protein